MAIGVITEQGFPAGQFGFEPLSESEQKKIEDAQKETKSNPSK